MLTVPEQPQKLGPWKLCCVSNGCSGAGGRGGWLGGSRCCARPIKRLRAKTTNLVKQRAEAPSRRGWPVPAVPNHPLWAGGTCRWGPPSENLGQHHAERNENWLLPFCYRTR